MPDSSEQARHAPPGSKSTDDAAGRACSVECLNLSVQRLAALEWQSVVLELIVSAFLKAGFVMETTTAVITVTSSQQRVVRIMTLLIISRNNDNSICCSVFYSQGAKQHSTIRLRCRLLYRYYGQGWHVIVKLSGVGIPPITAIYSRPNDEPVSKHCMNHVICRVTVVLPRKSHIKINSAISNDVCTINASKLYV